MAFFNLFFKKNYNLINNNFTNKLKLTSDVNTYKHFNEINLTFKNKNHNIIQHSNFSPNQSIQLTNKNIKNYLRSSMSQERLSGLSTLSIENELAFSLNLEQIVTDFSNQKARKVVF